ncbi:MAG: hypothetical protein MJ202_09590 [Lentisphaeria bacterium]|nr:hypothetical protein [Lentisphaeria bacterium]
MADESKISTVEFNQNARLVFNAETGLDEWVTPKTRMYTVPGVTGVGNVLRPLSMGELVMVVCLERATAMENDILAIMAEMNYNTEALNELTEIERQLVDGKSVADIKGPFYYKGVKYDTLLDFLKVLDIDFAPKVEELPFLEELEAKLDDHTVNVWDIGPITYQGKTYANINEACNSLQGMFTDRTRAFAAIEKFKQLAGDEEYVFLDEDLVIEMEETNVIDLPTYSLWRWKALFHSPVMVEDGYYIFNDRLRPAYQREIGLEKEHVLRILDSTVIDDLISQIEAKMDSMNSFSQQKMIELQSDTNKRDQSYDMISNILKSLHTTLMGNANNL